MITVSILLWRFYRQSIVGGEWILGTFEAKCIGLGQAVVVSLCVIFSQRRKLF
jgi:hypothetical protein